MSILSLDGAKEVALELNSFVFFCNYRIFHFVLRLSLEFSLPLRLTFFYDSLILFFSYELAVGRADENRYRYFHCLSLLLFLKAITNLLLLLAALN